MVNAAPAASAKTEAAIGQTIEDFTLQDAQSKQWTLAQLAGKKGTVVAFLGTECPLVKLYAGRLNELAVSYKSKGIHFVGVFSNSQDTKGDVANFLKASKLSFPAVLDKGAVVADKFSAARTPEVFLLDAQKVVRYRGRIDDQYGIENGINFQRKEVARKDLAVAVDELLAGKPISVAVTKAPGCLIGRLRETKADSPVTYSKQVSRILQKYCVECHRPGEIGPFPLQTYPETLGWGEMMLEVVNEQRMPPWHADPKVGHFANETRLTDQEKSDLTVWVQAGCPEGDPKELPPPRRFVRGWRIPKPDKIFKMAAKPYQVKDKGEIGYKNYFVDTNFKQDMYIQAAEARPGNRAVVHHIIVFVKAPGERLEQAIVGSGFLTSYAPGAQPLLLPKGLAKKIKAGSQLMFQMHYTPNGKETTDLSDVGLVFADPKSVEAEVKTDFAANFLFSIPANSENFPVDSAKTFREETLILNMYPHMHVRGKSFSYALQSSDGKSTPLLDVPKYDFNWQNTYIFKEPVLATPGSTLRCVAHYDNSAKNLNNPNPNANVHFGEQTWEEMMIGFFDTVSAPKEKQARILELVKSAPSAADVVTNAAAEEPQSASSENAAPVDGDPAARPQRVRPAGGGDVAKKAASYLKLARVMAKREEVKKARVWAQRALDLAPGSPQAVEAKALLEELSPK